VASIFLVRHGEAETNVAALLSHRLADLPLTERGRRQARLVADRLAEERPVAVYASPLLRARQTAECIATRIDAPLRFDDALREIDCGSLDGRGDEEAWAATRAVYARWKRDEWDARFPGGESLRELRDRLAGVVQAVVRTHPDEDVAVVGHGGLFWFGVPRLCPMPSDARTELLNTSVTVLRHHEGAVSCEFWACVRHLDGPS
jgi:broad specificity phosphatase PhoE